MTIPYSSGQSSVVRPNPKVMAVTIPQKTIPYLSSVLLSTLTLTSGTWFLEGTVTASPSTGDFTLQSFFHDGSTLLAINYNDLISGRYSTSYLTTILDVETTQTVNFYASIDTNLVVTCKGGETQLRAFRI